VSRRGTDGDGLLEALRGALALLEQSEESINALNVFPVPDGDTGSNMLATLRAALGEAEALASDDRTVGGVATAVGHGALMGARGNSGVILSQILRGMAEALAGRARMSPLDLAHALATGSQKAHSAVLKPVEGTILTVVREASAAAVAAAEYDPDMEAVLGAAVEAAEQAVARTPALLPVLREAGVVDAGGEGLYRILQGALRAIVAHDAAREPARSDGAHPAAVIAQGEDGFGYETMFLVTPAPGRSLDIDAIRLRLSELGESVLVAGDARAAKVHVHGDRPDQVLAFGLSLGPVSHVTIENLDRQAREARETRAHAFAGAAAVAHVHGPEGAHLHEGAQLLDHGTWLEPAAADEAVALREGGDHGHAEPSQHAGHRAVPHAGPPIVAVASGEGIVAIFHSFGVADVVGGGQSANPSAGELLRAAQGLGTDEVLVLPNNPNVKLAAQQAAALCHETRIVVVPTRNAPEGFAALLAYDAGRDAEANAATMLAAARSVQTLQVTDAIRDAKIGGRKVRKGHAIVLDPDDGLVATDANRREAVLAGVATLRPGFELLTVYYGGGADLAEAEDLTTALRAAYPAAEVELVHGGQPHYRFLLAAE
jgi:fatty acid kinase